MFPSTFSSFNRPTPTDRLNNPSHSALHNTVSSALGQVEAVIGLDSSILGTILGDLRNPNSDGGGHVQTANKGGTGQTSYSKGNLLVASSSSVLSKLSVGLDGQALVSDSSTLSGVKWATPGGVKIAASGVPSTLSSFVGERSVFSATVPGSTLGASGAIRATVYINHMEGNSANSSILLAANYGNTRVASILLVPGALGSVMGKIEYTLLSNGSTGAQRANMVVNLSSASQNQNSFQAPSSIISTMVIGGGSEDSNANKTLGINMLAGITAASDDRIDTNGYTIEKIV